MVGALRLFRWVGAGVGVTATVGVATTAAVAGMAMVVTTAAAAFMAAVAEDFMAVAGVVSMVAAVTINKEFAIFG